MNREMYLRSSHFVSLYVVLNASTLMLIVYADICRCTLCYTKKCIYTEAKLRFGHVQNLSAYASVKHIYVR